MRKQCLVGGLLLVSLSGLAFCAEPTPELERALGLVNQALQAEIDGNLLGRKRLLNESEHAAPECAPSYWFTGRVLTGDAKWATVDEAIEMAKANKQLDEYEVLRAQKWRTNTLAISIVSWPVSSQK